MGSEMCIRDSSNIDEGLTFMVGGVSVLKCSLKNSSVGIGTATPTAKLHVVGSVLLDATGETINLLGVPAYADDAAAGVGGLVTGDLYKTTTLGSTYLKIVP